MKIKRILHASDFSKASRPALALAVAPARAFKTELIIGHASPAPDRQRGRAHHAHGEGSRPHRERAPLSRSPARPAVHCGQRC